MKDSICFVLNMNKNYISSTSCLTCLVLFIYSYGDPDRNMSVLFNFHDIKVTENIKFISLFIQLCSSNILMYVRIFPSYIRHKPIEN